MYSSFDNSFGRLYPRILKMPDSEDTTETSTPTEKVDLDNYYNSVQAAIDEMNNKTGDTLSMERTSITPGIKINLSH